MNIVAVQLSGIWQPQTEIPNGTLSVLAAPSGYTAAAPSDFHLSSPPSVDGGITNVFNGSKTISADYFGITYHRYPGGTTPKPSTYYKVCRSHDYAPGSKRVRWSSIEAVQGAPDWSALDDFVATNFAAGQKIIHTIYGSPSWASARPAEPSAYGNGIAAEPSNLANWDAHCTALAQRYQGRIAFYEIWNEPNLSSFYTGTQTILSQMVRRANQAIKAVDSAAKIISPAVTSLQTGNGQSYFAAMMAASDGAAGNMASWTDSVGVHLYPDGVAGVTKIPTFFGTFSSSLAGLGLSGKPVMNTEFGVLTPSLSSYSSSTERIALVTRMMLLAAVCGVGCTSSVWYDGDFDSIYGFPSADDIRLWNSMVKILSSAPVSVVNVLRDGRVAAVIGGINYLF